MTAAKRLLELAVLALLLSALAGCASKIDRRQLMNELRSIKGPKGQVTRVVPIHADTRMEALARLGEARSEPRSSLSLDLGKQLKITRSRRMTFVVGGPYPDLADQIVQNALEYNKGAALPGLTLVYVSPDPPTDELKVAFKRKRARLFHKKLELD